MINQMNRRRFLQESTLLAGTGFAAVGFAPYLFSPQLYAEETKSDRLRMGAIGVGSMGRHDLVYFDKLADVVAVCDVDSEYGLAPTLKAGYGRKKGDEVIAPDAYADYRRILDRDDIDFIMIATPDHWHTKIAVEALQAGKHVFCEKPLTLTLEENIIIRKAVEKYGKTFQVGTMQRSFGREFMLATLIIRGGYLGEITKVTCDIGDSPSSEDIPKVDVPTSLDWNTWLGQAPLTDFLASEETTFYKWEAVPAPRPAFSRCHFNFRWWYEYSGGKFTDWGAHHIDCALWALGYQSRGTGPTMIDGTDSKHPIPFKEGEPTVTNRYNTCEAFNIYHHFPSGLVMNVASTSADGNGILFEGTKGRLHVSRGRVKGRLIEEGIANQFQEEDYLALNHGTPFDDFASMKGQDRAYHEHKVNFLRCIRSGAKPISDVESHIECAHLCHLSGIAARLKRKINWDPNKEEIVGDEQAASFFARTQRKGFEIPVIH